MRIGIVGTRGIPNRYGGFEQCAEHLAPRMVTLGHEVIVYNPSFHEFPGDEWNGVRIQRVRSLEPRLGAVGNMAYDRDCLKDAFRKGCDIVLSLGYAPGSLFFPRSPRSSSAIVTNMDGLEWSRSKWSPAVRRLLRHCEAKAVGRSDSLIADNPGIQEYLQTTYGVRSTFIPYGADHGGPGRLERLTELELASQQFDCLIARLEPENNVQMVVEGHIQSGVDRPLIVIGSVATPLGHRLQARYGGSRAVRFLGGIYDGKLLDALRTHANSYYHGHSVGGTNPSLLEAMAAKAFIVAHDNRFNRSVLGEAGVYFGSADDVAAIARETRADRSPSLNANARKVATVYTWDKVTHQYVRAFEETLAGKALA